MKYSVAILAFAAGVLALPQDASITSAPVASASLTPAVSCVLDCEAGDVTCQAACMGNARPNSQQVVDTNNCAAACDQGSGSKEDTEAYAKCQQDCFASLFPSSQTNFQGAAGGVSHAASAAASAASSAVASATNAAGSAVSSVQPVASAARSGAESATGSDAPSGSETGSGAQSTDSPGAASANSVKIAGAGLAGLLAIFAL
ncbi:hypothetical protein P171DRAFT_474804 [Karstenula rhodostoma CBS 690.94]|uniref:Extracellular membrane protein CFEM domain-containing protein n=1 Tax=Karstenula rhodostoma CBS 690.94 TaxID=1392251 RepID=A0A9P4PGA0_9PLEO|nr:hypothetical protein P171DRAFT_474804 [Karstenula rhodostoma CBS 690.94]